MSAVPVSGLTPAQIQMAETTIRKATDYVAAIVTEIRTHLRNDSECPAYCVGEVATQALDALPENTVRQLLHVALREIAAEATR